MVKSVYYQISTKKNEYNKQTHIHTNTLTQKDIYRHTNTYEHTHTKKTQTHKHKTYTHTHFYLYRSEIGQSAAHEIQGFVEAGLGLLKSLHQRLVP